VRGTYFVRSEHRHFAEALHYSQYFASFSESAGGWVQLQKDSACGEGGGHCGGCYRGIIVVDGEGSDEVGVEMENYTVVRLCRMRARLGLMNK